MKAEIYKLITKILIESSQLILLTENCSSYLYKYGTHNLDLTKPSDLGTYDSEKRYIYETVNKIRHSCKNSYDMAKKYESGYLYDTVTDLAKEYAQILDLKNRFFQKSIQ